MMLRGTLVIAIVAVLVYKVMDHMFKSGSYTQYKKHHPGECRQVKGLNFGSEDLEITKDGLAFVTSGLSFATLSASFLEFSKTNNIKGRIFLYDFNKPNLDAKELQLVPSKDFNPDTFHPHGLSLLEDKVKGEHILYVINHPDNEDDAVEKFKYLPSTHQLVHLRSFRNDHFHVTNDIAVTEEDKFYVSNYLYFKNPTMNFIEVDLLPVGLGSVIYFNGTHYTEVLSGLFGPNGILLSRDKRYLYVNVLLQSTLSVYERKNDNSLVRLQSVYLHTMADNLHLSESGDALYTGAHPIVHKLMDHLHDPRHLAPSSVLRIPLKNGLVVAEDITELFYDHGDLISGSSSAAVYNNKLLIGSVINKLVICNVNVKSV